MLFTQLRLTMAIQYMLVGIVRIQPGEELFCGSHIEYVVSNTIQYKPIQLWISF